MSQSIRGQGGHLGFPMDPKNTDLVEDVEILLPVKFGWIPFSSFREVKSVSATRGPGGCLGFPIGPKNTNLIEDVVILLTVKFRWITFSDYRKECENVSVNQRPRRPSWISDRPQKHRLGRGHWRLRSWFLSSFFLNSVQQFQRSQKFLS